MHISFAIHTELFSSKTTTFSTKYSTPEARSLASLSGGLDNFLKNSIVSSFPIYGSSVPDESDKWIHIGTVGSILV